MEIKTEKFRRQVIMSPKQLQNMSFNFAVRTRTTAKWKEKNKDALAKRAKVQLFLTVKYANLWRSCRHGR